MNAQAEHAGSLVQQAMQAVIEHIRGHALRAGDTLPGEKHFAMTLGVSRAVMREAFGALAAQNRIDVANGRKPRVAAVDASVISISLNHAISTAQISVPEVWDVRRVIERRTAQLAAINRSAQDATLILHHAAQIAADVDDLELTTQHDIAFHEAIAKASANALFVQIVQAFGSLMKIAVPLAWETRTTQTQRDVIIRRHRNIARAIKAQDPDAAANAMDAHFDNSIGAVLRGIVAHPIWPHG